MIRKINVVAFFVFNVVILVTGFFYGINDEHDRSFSGVKTSIAFNEKSSEKYDDQKVALIDEKDENTKKEVDVLGINQENVLGEAESDPQRNLFNQAKQENIVEENNKGKFSFVVFGDSEEYSEKGYDQDLPAVLSSGKKQNPDLVFFAGDLLTLSADSLEGNGQRLRGALSLLENYFNKYYIAFGNHDLECGQDCLSLWQKEFFKKEIIPGEKISLNHSFDHQNTHFVILSTNYPLQNKIDDDQLGWLEKDLSQTKKVNKVVIEHVSPVTFFNESAERCHDMSCDSIQRGKLLEVFRKYGVDLVVSGHEAVFDHKVENNIDYVLAGNVGGKSIYKNTIKGNIYSLFYVSDSSISLKAPKDDERVLREIKIK